MYAYVLAAIAVGYLILAYLPFSRLMFLQDYQTLLDTNQAFYQLMYFTIPLAVLGAILFFITIKLFKPKSNRDIRSDKAFSIATFCALAGVTSSLLVLTFSAAYSFGMVSYFVKPAPWSAEELERIAIHEAGHAVMREIEYPNSTIQAEIIAPDAITNSLSWFSQPLPSGYVLGSRDSRLMTKEDIEKSIRIYLAGLAAEKLLYPENQWYTSSDDDLEMVKHLVTMMCNNGLSSAGPVPWEILTEEERSSLFQEVVNEQESIVEEKLQQNKQSVIAVSEELMGSRFLTGEQVRAIISN